MRQLIEEIAQNLGLEFDEDTTDIELLKQIAELTKKLNDAMDDAEWMLEQY
jgi:hypothetical protein